jgi:predicted dehydrogenase
MAELRGALLGCGQVSQYHLRAWAQIEGVRIVALYNRTRDKAEARAREFSIPGDHVHTNYRELLARETLDFVDVASAPQAHRPQVEAAAAYGLHVLCQKPLALSLEDTQAMIEACDRARVLFAANENWRWRAWYRELKKLLDQRTIGQVRYARFVKHRNITLPGTEGGLPVLAREQPYTTDLEKLIVLEWGTHLVDVVRFLFGEIRSAYARLKKVSLYFKGEDRALIVLDVKGVDVLLDLSWATLDEQIHETGPDTQLEQVIVEGDEGTITLSPKQSDPLRISIRDHSWTRPRIWTSGKMAYQDSYTAAHRHFIECLRTGMTPETVAHDNLKTLQATFAVYESAAKNQVIHLA